jgi:PAS domain S-box-containing protein
VTASPLLDQAGNRYGAIESIRDITEHKRAEESVRRSEAELRAFVENAPHGIYRSSVKQDRFLSVNPALVQTLGYASAADVLALKLSRDLYFTRDEHDRFLAQALRLERFGAIEVRWKHKDGKPIIVRVSGRRVQESADGGDDLMEGITDDVTERRSLEAQYQQAQKMEAVGRLAGGVAHDFNNLLMVIMGNAQAAADLIGGEHRAGHHLDEICKASDRAASLTQQLLAFSRKQALQPEVLSLNAVVADMGKMLQRLIGEDIRLGTKLNPSLSLTKVDRGQIGQVVMNLAVNARDAMPQGGTLTIETDNVEWQEAGDRAEARPGPCVMLAVSDTGIGMDEPTQGQIFEPFFTTKSHGTGLGLATVYGIVKQSGGWIRLRSAPGCGSTFSIYFPVAGAANARMQPTSSVPAPLWAGTVLLAEDSEPVRAVIRDYLQGQGCKVLEATNGHSALEVAAQYPGTIQLLLSDLVMPDMGGSALAEKLLESRPDTRVLYMSGYMEDVMVHHRILDRGDLLLPKPFTQAQLAAKIRDVFKAPKSEARKVV